MEPKISICIHTRNRLSHLKQCIPSILEQTYSNFELIIIDYNCLQNSYDFIKKNFNDERIIVYKHYDHEKKWSRSLAKNIAVSYSTCDILFIVDCDNILSKNFLAQNYEHLKQNKRTFLAGGHPLSQNIPYGLTMCHKVDFLNSGGFNEKCEHGWGYEDVDLFIRLYKQCNSITPFIGNISDIKHNDNKRNTSSENKWLTNNFNVVSSLFHFESIFKKYHVNKEVTEIFSFNNTSLNIDFNDYKLFIAFQSIFYFVIKINNQETIIKLKSEPLDGTKSFREYTIEKVDSTKELKYNLIKMFFSKTLKYIEENNNNIDDFLKTNIQNSLYQELTAFYKFICKDDNQYLSSLAHFEYQLVLLKKYHFKHNGILSFKTEYDWEDFNNLKYPNKKLTKTSYYSIYLNKKRKQIEYLKIDKSFHKFITNDDPKDTSLSNNDQVKYNNKIAELTSNKKEVEEAIKVEISY